MAINKLIIGGSGTGKEFVIVRMNAERYNAFQMFCEENQYSHNVTISENNEVKVNCEKGVFMKFCLFELE